MAERSDRPRDAGPKLQEAVTSRSQPNPWARERFSDQVVEMVFLSFLRKGLSNTNSTTSFKMLRKKSVFVYVHVHMCVQCVKREKVRE